MYTWGDLPYREVFKIIHRTAGPQQFWSIKKIWIKTAGPQQFYGWTTNLPDLSSSMDGFGPKGPQCHQNCGPWQFYGWFWAQTHFQFQQNCWTSAVLWMVLGPMAKITTELLDLSSFMDGFGPYGLSVIRTADLGSSMDCFGPNK